MGKLKIPLKPLAVFTMDVNPESVQTLLASENYGDRLTGLNQLRELDPSKALELIQPVLSDENVRVRYAAVSQLATLGEQNRSETVAALITLLEEDKELDIKAAAADALGALHCAEAYPKLEAAYQNSNDWVLQLSIIAALGELGNPAGFELLETALSSETELVRIAAITALGELGDERAIALVAPLAKDGDWQLRSRVAQALGNFKDNDTAKSVLQTLANDKSEQVAQMAKAGLA